MKTRIYKNFAKGFTMVELSLALVFISIMLISLAVIIYNITSLYQKGLSIRAVNSTGREMVDDISRAISSSPTIPLTTFCTSYFKDDNPAKADCIKDNARLFIYQQEYGNVEINGTTQNVPLHGTFCTGRYSYIWNTGYALNADAKDDDGDDTNNRTARVKYTEGDEDKYIDNFRLLKIADSSRSVCREHLNVGNIPANNKYEIVPGRVYSTDAVVNNIEEVLEHSEEDLVLYDFVIFRPTQHYLTNHSFYSGTFTLSTLGGTVDITGAGSYCTEAPDGLVTDFNYCAINKFNFAMRAEGQLKTGE